MPVQETSIHGLYQYLAGNLHQDERGSFRETFHKNELEEAIRHPLVEVQENTVISIPSVIRGIHVAPWSKRVYVLLGKVLAVIVDPRKDSPTFRSVYTIELSAEKGNGLFLPPRLGNSYGVIGDQFAIYRYAVSHNFSNCQRLGIGEKGISLLDPTLGISWPVENPIINLKDRANPTLDEFLMNDHDELFRWTGQLVGLYRPIKSSVNGYSPFAKLTNRLKMLTRRARV